VELRKNRVKRKLANDQVAVVAAGFTHPDDIDAFGPVGFDGVWLEGEHGGVDAAELGNLTRACDIWGMTSVVRINANDQGLIYRTLDRGAQDIVVPHVNSAAEAGNVVAGG
jgi:4-hydroxy-2-oxoheptanedioate aldolase